MSPVKFKKRPYCAIKFKGQGPLHFQEDHMVKVWNRVFSLVWVPLGMRPERPVFVQHVVRSSLPLTTNLSQKLTQPSKGISYLGDFCRCFTKLTGPSAYTLQSNPISPTDGTNGLL